MRGRCQAVRAALPLLAACGGAPESLLSTRDLPPDIAWYALARQESEQIVEASPLTSRDHSRSLREEGAARSILLGFTAAELDRHGATPDDEPLHGAAPCEPPLLPALARALEGGAPAPSLPVSASWLCRAVDPTRWFAAERPFRVASTPELAGNGCRFRLRSGACTQFREMPLQGWEGELCLGDPACAPQAPPLGALGRWSCAGCTLEIWPRGQDDFARVSRHALVQVTGPYPPGRGYRYAHRSGYLRDLLLLPDALVATSYQPPAATCTRGQGMRLHRLGLDLAPIAERGAPVCLEALAPLPDGRLLGLYVDGPELVLQAFGSDLLPAERVTVALSPEQTEAAVVAAAVDGAELYLLLGFGGAGARQHQLYRAATAPLRPPSSDGLFRDTGSEGGTGRLFTMVAQGGVVFLFDDLEDVLWVLLEGHDEGRRDDRDGVHTSRIFLDRRTRGAGLLLPESGIDGVLGAGLRLFGEQLGLEAAPVGLFEDPLLRPLAAAPWGAEEDLYLVAGSADPPSGVPRPVRVARFRREREGGAFLPGVQEVGVGVPGALATREGVVWMLLPQTGEILRLEPR